MILEERTLLMLEAFEGVELLSQDAINKQKSFCSFPLSFTRHQPYSRPNYQKPGLLTSS